jgi:hypothetical protein
VLLIGDAHALNPYTYPQPSSGHAFVVTNYYTDESGSYVWGCTGVDSNFPQTEVRWTMSQVDQAAAWATRWVLSTPLLVTDAAFNWPYKAQYYRMLRSGELAAVPY